MKKFIKDVIFLVIIPYLLVWAPTVPFYFMVKDTGELESITINLKKQRENHKILIGLGYNEQTSYYKLVNANYYQKDVIALGTSRVMQFKHEFFNKNFYNCGGAVRGNYDEYLNFLQNLTYKPDIILLGLDAWVFNDAWNKNCLQYDKFRNIQEIDRGKGAVIYSIIKDWILKKWEIADLDLYPDNIGFNGCVKDEGFMYDGSYYYGYIYRSPEKQKDYKFVDTLQRISKGISRFEWAKEIDDETFVQLENLLHYCQKSQIYVIGFLAPFAPSIYAEMVKSGNYEYITKISPLCKTLFEKYEFEFFDYMDGAELNVTDEFFIDGFHGSEIVYGYILKDMANKNSRISKYLNQVKIDELLENPYSGLVFFNPDFISE